MSARSSARRPWRPRFERTLSPSRWGEYRQLLRAARDHGYEIVALEDWIDGTATGERPTLILRHDVDQAPRSVLRMLAIEREEGVLATWYFRWRTAVPAAIAAVREAGGGVGLHYETLSRLVRERRLPPDAAARMLPEARADLRAEIDAFAARFGPVRSVCPHGDTGVPGVRNATLLEGEDWSSYGIEFDGNAAMRERPPRLWITDRASGDGRWSDGAAPPAILAQGVTPLLCVVHPNNWVSGFGLWGDRLLRGLAERPPLRPLLTNVPTDRPPTDG